MSGWTWLWVFWFAMFFAIELPAVFNKTPNDTLSEHIWKWASVKTKAAGWRIRRLILVIALGVLSYHFMSGHGWFIF